MVDNPIYKHWSALESALTIARRVRPADSYEEASSIRITLVKDTTIKLLEVTAKKVVVELTESEHGRGFNREQPHRSCVFRSHPEGLGTPRREPAKHKQEDVRVRIKARPCRGHWWTRPQTRRYDSDPANPDTDEVPGGILKDVKMQKKGDQLVSESTLEILSYKVP